MTVNKYEVRFEELAKHDIMILPIEYEIWYFVKGLRLSLYRDTLGLVALGKSLTEIANHGYTIEEMDCDAQRGNM